MSPLTVSPRSLSLGSLLRERALEVRGDLFGDVGEGKRLHLAAQAAELRVQRVAAIAGLGRGLFDFSVDRQGVVPVRQPCEAIGFLQSSLEFLHRRCSR